MAVSLSDKVRDTISDTVGCLISEPWRKPDGGVGQTPDTVSDTWSTAEVLVLARRMQKILPWFPGMKASDATQLMKEWLLPLQQIDGSWPTYDDPAEESSGDVVGTSLALLALWEWRTEPDIKTAAHKAIGWLAKAVNADHGWSAAFSRFGSNSSTAFPTVFGYQSIAIWKRHSVGNIQLMAEVIHGAKAWLSTVRKGSLLAESIIEPEPTPRHTSYLVLADEAARGLNLNRDQIVKFLVRSQHANGMWSYAGEEDVETTAVAMRALLALGVSPRDRVVTDAVQALLQRLVPGVAAGGERYQGWPDAPDGQPTSYLTFYSLMALLDFYSAIRAANALTQRLRGRGLRKYASGILLALAVAGYLFAGVWAAGVYRLASATLSTALLGLGIVVAIPAVIGAWNRRR